VSADWKTVTLGDVAEFVRGINFKPDDVVPTGTPGAVACMRTKNVQAELDLSDVWSVGEEFVRREDQFLQTGDVLVSSANSWNLVGKCCWIPELPGRASFGGFVSVLRSHRAKVEPRFLYRWFSSGRIQTTLRSFGQQTTNISNLNTDRCLKLPLPLPPLAEQRRIAEVLDRAEALRAKRRAALAQLDSLTQSLFLDLFGDPRPNEKSWPLRSLKELGKVKTGGTPPSAKPGMFGGPIPFVTPGDLESEQPVKRSVTEAGAVEAETVRAGATLVCCIGATIGKMGKATQHSAFNQQINAVEWANGVDDNYGLGVLRFFKPQIATWGASTTLPILKKSSFEKIEIPVPPLPLQREFARRVTAVEKLKTAQRASQAELDALFAALQHRAFRGEL
jgi:type I restriction enzyme S subunit